MNILFLYTRLPDYFLQCIRHLMSSLPEGSKAFVVHYDADKDAPYAHQHLSTSIELIPKSRLDIDSISTLYKPDLIYIAGWGDKTYKAIGHQNRKFVPVVMGLDNPWTGKPRQRMAAWLAPLLIKKYCTHLWVAGIPQYEFARRLGFRHDQILKGLYCANIGNVQTRNDSDPASRIILFTGRMVAYKRPYWLIKAFEELIQKYPELDNWQLKMIGEGPLRKELQNEYKKQPKIIFESFVQPEALGKVYAEATVFCLPSHNEHWGVVVQEAAAAGLPMLLSTTCGAASEFLVNGYNGYLFNSDSFHDFKKKLYLLMTSDQHELRKMGKAGQQLSKRITQDNWAAALKSVLIGEES